MLSRTIEAILFASGKSVALTTLAKLTGVSVENVQIELEKLVQARNTETSGIHILVYEGKAQCVTHPQEAEVIQSFLKEEVSGELTAPSVETLTIIVYRGPITKPEIEQIRGVNCSLILRNLLIRGLIEEHEDKQRLQNTYTISFEFLRHLGVDHVEDLPQYTKLHADEVIQQFIQETPSSV